MLILHVSGEQCHQKMRSTLLTLDSAALPFTQSNEPLPTIIVYLSKVRSHYLLQDRNYCDGFCCVCVEADSFKQFDQDVKRRLQKGQVSCLDQAIIGIKRSKESAYLCPNP